MGEIDFEQLKRDMGALDEDAVLSVVRNADHLTQEIAAQMIGALSEGMNIVGEKFDFSEYFVGDLIFAGEIFSEAMDILKEAYPFLGNRGGTKVILATVEGDLHDIGKNIVRVVLESKGFQVIDLGVSVAPSIIVKTAMEEEAHIIALSAVLSSALEAMARTVAEFVKAGIRDQVSIIVGGACVTPLEAKRMKADYYADTPEDTAAICMKL